MGLGWYESRIFYAGKAFPGQSGEFWDWFRSPHRGDTWIKIGDSDKLARALWQYSALPAKMAWLRYFGGNWVFAMLAEWIVSNTVATIIRTTAKYGEMRLDLGVSLPFLK